MHFHTSKQKKMDTPILCQLAFLMDLQLPLSNSVNWHPLDLLPLSRGRIKIFTGVRRPPFLILYNTC